MPTKTENKTNKFNPNEHLEDIKGKPYLPAAWRLVWFREEHPDWGIRTEIVSQDEKQAIMRATIFNKECILATAHKKEDKIGFGDFLEKAETGAIARALAMCGFGTQFSPDIEEGTERIVDSPVTPKTVTKQEVKRDTIEYIDTEEGATQIRRYFALAKTAGLEPENAKKLAKMKLKLESFTQVTKEQLKSLTEAMAKTIKEKEQKDSMVDEITYETDFSQLR